MRSNSDELAGAIRYYERSNNHKLIIIMHFNTHCIPESIEDKMEVGDPVVSPIVFVIITIYNVLNQ